MLRRRCSVAVAGLVLTSLLAAPATGDAAVAAQRQARPAKLVRFDSCEALTRFARARMVQTDGSTGVPFGGDVVTPAVLRPPALMPDRRRTAGPSPQATDAPAAQGGAPEVSSTNVQEAGVDEPDLVKTDGQRLYVAGDAVLRVFDITGPAPRPIGRLALPGTAHQLLLRGPRLLVLAAAGPGQVRPLPEPTVAAPVPEPLTQKVLLTEVDVSDPATPTVARTMELAGVLAGARLTAGTARVIVASTPEPIAAPDPPTLQARASRARLRRFLPATTIRSRISRRTFRRSVVPCSHVRRPLQFSGLDLLSVLTIDLDRGLFSVARDAVMAGAQQVYASPAMLVVASRRYSPLADGIQPSGGTTELHAFDAGAEPRTAYLGTGSVPGFVLNQFALSEHAGALRVATTEEAPFAPQGDPVGQSESGVSVLKLAGGRLTTVGRVTGLGKGERIHAVRFLGERGYVVTFRQIDPLYTLDLRDPAAPKVSGELKVTGFSAYLHPISDTLLLGVGQDATEEGRSLGPQVSLFDVADPARPRLLGRAALGGSGGSAAEQDHHAFLWWAPAHLAVLPFETYDDRADRAGASFSGAIGFRVVPDGVSEVGRITHPAPSPDAFPPPIGRSVAVGDRLLTLSSAGIATNRLTDLAPLAFTPLG